jgi:sulfite oxidase
MWGKRGDMVVRGEDPYNAESSRAALAGHPLTPTEAFYSRNHGSVPSIDAADWRLRVDGLVGQTLELTRQDLEDRFERRSVIATLQCAGNRRASLIEVRAIPGEDPWGSGVTSTASWTGVSLADVLRAAGVQPGAHDVGFEAQDMCDDALPPQRYGSSIPVAKASSPEVLLAWQMNGEDLPAIHGGPVRVVVPGYIGARSVKWVDRVTVLPAPSENYFQATAYRLLPPEGEPGPGLGISLGPIALNCDILEPDDGARLPTGPTDVSGYALAGDGRQVVRVDVSLDQGRTWVQADLDEVIGDWAWRLWRTRLSLPEGPVRITTRAWDDSGATQPESAAEVWNPKGYANNSWGHVTVHATRTGR